MLARIRTSLRLKQAIDATLGSRREMLSATAATLDAVCRQEGDYWTLAYHGQVCRFKDTKGLHYLAFLLARPGEACHVVTLVAAVEQPATLPGTATSTLRTEQLAAQHLSVGDLGDAGPILDAAAKAAYKRRLDELQAELTEAQRFHDLVRVTQAQAELDFLTAELTAAVGLGGRDRRAASHTERARLMVTKALRATLSKVSDSHPALGHHFTTSITTGMFCTYTPDPASPLTWNL